MSATEAQHEGTEQQFGRMRKDSSKWNRDVPGRKSQDEGNGNSTYKGMDSLMGKFVHSSHLY